MIYPTSTLLSIVFLLVFLLFLPLLYYPAKYALSGKIKYSGLSAKDSNSGSISDSKEYQISNEEFTHPTVSEFIESSQSEASVSAIKPIINGESIPFIKNSISDNSYIKVQTLKKAGPFNKATERKLTTFYNKEAIKYFDTIDFDYDSLVRLIYFGTPEGLNYKIVLHDQLSSNEIKDMLQQLKYITKISMKDLSELFLKFNRKSNEIEPINWSSIKSSVSQNFKIRSGK